MTSPQIVARPVMVVVLVGGLTLKITSEMNMKFRIVSWPSLASAVEFNSSLINLRGHKMIIWIQRKQIYISVIQYYVYFVLACLFSCEIFDSLNSSGFRLN